MPEAAFAHGGPVSGAYNHSRTIAVTATKDAAETLTALSAAELARRQHAVREAIASATIEGGDVGPEARAIMVEWAEGRIDKETMIQRALGLD